MKYFYILIICSFFTSVSVAQTTTTARNGDVTIPRVAVKILKVFPNPATTYITFEFQRSYNTGLAIEIYNLPGKKVAGANNLSSSTTIQLQNFYRGVYIFKLLDRNGKVMESGKFNVVK
jgi:hypothetical protein